MEKELPVCVKVGSQCDGRPCIALICEKQNFLIRKFSDFLAIRHKDATQRNTRIESESILASDCVATSVNAMHGIASYCEPTLKLFYNNIIMTKIISMQNWLVFGVAHTKNTGFTYIWYMQHQETTAKDSANTHPLFFIKHAR